MAKLTKQQAKRHGEAESLLSLDRNLTFEQREFVFQHWHPGAEHLVSTAGQFFTPVPLAREFAIYPRQEGTVVDLGAGIGVLGWHLWLHSRRDVRVVAVEICPSFVEVGRKVFPEAEWILADAFSRDLWEDLGIVGGMMGNPPFGDVKTASADWMTYKGPAHLMACELALRFSETGATFILPGNDLPEEFSDYKGRVRRRGRGGYFRKRDLSKVLKKFMAAFPSACFHTCPSDVSIYLNAWQGVSPEVEIVNIDTDPPSYGLGFQQGRLL